MEGRCLIVSGGEFHALPRELFAADCVIACDRGYEYARRLGIAPDRIVGDFDSAPMPVTNTPIDVLPTRKDDTDTMFAARRALELGYRDVVICCAFGGRLDHTLANIQTAAYLAAHGARARLLGAHEDALAFAGGTERFARRAGYSLSVFALAGKCEGVTIRGTKFECEDETLSGAFPLGVSNVWKTGAAEITVKNGILLVLQSKLKEGEHI